jgi:DNA-binding MarR family transcriptional regulator
MEDVNRASAGERRPARAATRLYDAELRGAGLRQTQYVLLRLLERGEECRQGDLGAMACLEETSVTRALRPLARDGWVSVRAGSDRREKLVSITGAGLAKLEEAGPAWRRAQERLRAALPGGVAPEALIAHLQYLAGAAGDPG